MFHRHRVGVQRGEGRAVCLGPLAQAYARAGQQLWWNGDAGCPFNGIGFQAAAQGVQQDLSLCLLACGLFIKESRIGFAGRTAAHQCSPLRYGPV